MRSTTKTRVQRRVEKKQAALLVVLVLVIALASFALGVIVGRHTVEPTIVQQELEPRRIIVAEPSEATPGAGPGSAEPAEEKLTFYDNLSKEEPAPIGSGINLPPAGETPPVEEPQAVESPTPAAEVVAAVAAEAKPSGSPEVQPTPLSAPVTPEVTPPTPTANKMPGVTKGGDWVVQVFSSQSAADAGTLRDKLNAKGYPAYITEADLGKKGIWYRVNLGPYADKNIAQQAQAYAETKDQLKGFAKRR